MGHSPASNLGLSSPLGTHWHGLDNYVGQNRKTNLSPSEKDFAKESGHGDSRLGFDGVWEVCVTTCACVAGLLASPVSEVEAQ